MTDSIADLRDRLQAANEESTEEHLRCYEYCVDCDELYEEPMDMPEACFEDHQTIHDCHDNDGLGEWLACLDYLDEMGAFDA